jgi:amino acid transporter
MNPERETDDRCPTTNSDEQTLSSLGYQQELPRILRMWTNWAVGFAYISPIVGLYTVVALNAATAGPSWVWTVAIVTAGQLIVAVCYMQLAARWPVAGGIYQWSRRLVGPRFGWWAGWVYLWALIVTLSLVAYAGGGFLAELFGVHNPSTGVHILFSLVVMAAFTAVNLVGLQVLRFTVNVGIACELVGSVGIGLALILLFRKQPVAVLTDTHLVPEGTQFLPAFIGALAVAGWVLLGFDACGSLAEETKDAARRVPKAMVLSIITVGVVDMIAAAGLMLATPDIGALLRGEVGDPVSGAVVAALGEWAKTPFLAVVVISFVACGIAVQGATVRVMYSYSRDRMLPMWQVWRKVSPRNQTPMYAVLLVAVLASLTFLYANALSVLGGLATGGYYLAFLFPICGVLVVRLRRRWAEGPYTFGRLGDVLAGVAAVWLLGELINIAWPRQPDLPWYQNWAVEVGLGAACLIGLGYSLRAHPERNLPNPGPGGQHRTPEAAVPRTTGDPRATTHD